MLINAEGKCKTINLLINRRIIRCAINYYKETWADKRYHVD